MKKGSPYIVPIALILLEILLILNLDASPRQEAISFWRPVWASISPILVFLIIPMFVVAILVRSGYALCSRLGWGVKPKLRIRPLDSVLENSRFNGKAASILLFKELTAFISSEQHGEISKNVRPGSRNTQGPTIKLVGATLPFEWIRNNIRKYLGITDYEIRGLIDDSNDRINITAWSSDYLKDIELTGGHWEADSSEWDGSYSLQSVIESLATRIAEEIAPKTTGMLFWSQHRYAEAREILSSQLRAKKSRTAQNHSDLGWLYHECDHYQEAVIEFENARKRIKHRLFGLYSTHNDQSLEEEISWGCARAYAGMGMYDDSIQLLESQARSKESSRILIELGTTYFLKGYPNEGLETSLAIYEQAERKLIADLDRELAHSVTLVGTQMFMFEFSEQLHNETPLRHEYYIVLLNCRDRIPELTNCDEVANILRDLADLYSDRSRVIRIHRGGEAAKFDIEKAVLVLALFSHFEAYVYRYESLSLRLEELGQYYNMMNRYDEAKIWLSEALLTYEDDINRFLTEAGQDEKSIASLTNLAWAYCGQHSCLVRLVENKVLQYRLKYDYLLPIFDSITDMVEILDFVPEEEQYNWALSLESIPSIHDSFQYWEALSDAIYHLITAVWKHGTEEQQQAMVKYSETFYNAGEESQDTASSLKALDAIGSQIGVDTVHTLVDSLADFVPIPASQIQRICIKLVLVVDHLAHSVSSEDVSDVVVLAQHEAKTVESRNLAIEGFGKLQAYVEIHHQAEAHFGAACIYAIEKDEDSAVYHLEEAIRVTTRRGSLSSEYHNRAKLAPDFDSIRSTEAFQGLVCKI